MGNSLEEDGGVGEMVLACHPGTPALAVRAITARVIGLDAHWLSLRWRIEGAGRIVAPPFAGRVRCDGLWQATCFELFLRAGESGYAEFNISPSEAFAAYDFTAYRVGMAERPLVRPPVGSWRRGAASGDLALFDVALPRDGLPALPAAMALSAVIEEAGEDGARRKSYWALAHAPGRPDFHHEACFAARLPAPAVP